MAARRTAWVLLWVLHAVQTARGQVTTCTAKDGSQCYPADISADCSPAGSIGTCDRLGTGFGCYVSGLTTSGQDCAGTPGCKCLGGMCVDNNGLDLCVYAPACPQGTDMCDDPHMKGLRGQKIDWSGVDGGWYCIAKDESPDIHVNVRLTAPLPEEFPDRQLITGLSVISEGHSLAVEVKNPYDIVTDGCPRGISPCLANGGLRIVVNGIEVNGLLRSARHAIVADGIAVSASNLPVECRQFGGDKIWARMYGEMMEGLRQLEVVQDETFEDWILGFDDMAAPDWCARYIAEHDLADVQSIHTIFKIVTPSVTVRLNVGPNHQGDGELDWDGRTLPDLEFWQMDVGLEGLSLDSQSLSGILGETARPVLDKDGRPVMEGNDAFRGTVEDYRVSGPLGTQFSLHDQTQGYEQVQGKTPSKPVVL